MRRRTTLLVMAATVLAPRLVLAAGRTPSPPGAEAYIIWPSDGATITGGKFWVRMGLRNMGICPKGIERPNVGHHHLLIDADLPPLDQPIPSDRNHLHYGAGQTEARIELPPGKHTLQLLMGDHDHVPHDPPVYSKKITITVK
ncbi:ATPase [Burkholderia ubonensis]|uniref:ATPase n=2 Tax=Burkholderia ubonensis TaxID=101571 RepID=A0AAW3NGP4_9BURK|nr:ATPase [Burkholderia ubonensis]